MKTGSKKRYVALAALVLFALLFVRCKTSFSRTRGQELLDSIVSPDGTYTLNIYRNSGGATTPFSILGQVVITQTGRSRNIFWKYRAEDVSAYWIDDTTVRIDGVELDVTTRNTYRDYGYER